MCIMLANFSLAVGLLNRKATVQMKLLSKPVFCFPKKRHECLLRRMLDRIAVRKYPSRKKFTPESDEPMKLTDRIVRKNFCAGA